MNVVPLLVTLALASIAVAAAAQPTYIATFLKEREAEDAGLKLIARSPNPAIVPVSLYEKDNSAPSCGVLIAPPHGGKSSGRSRTPISPHAWACRR